MSGPLICPRHGQVFLVSTSPVLGTAISGGNLPKDCRIAIVEVDSTDEFGKIQEYWVDFAFLEKFSLSPVDGVLRLKNRSRPQKLLNDRLLIQKIFSETVSECPHCLDELVSCHREGRDFVPRPSFRSAKDRP
jgi:hypothetical protein